ncbi:hypothetical protein BSK65_25625 [Paenibacillus odorifer]|uniref:histidine kinase n=1 Tax=Paenibacillus odorifer TaxID=189426 RepID=A0A1R0Z9P3_9BACL|nr:sensor histidine kinase [Paenibacillus odorifer]OME65080.1 hypothetical protein BSK65_25625 [Paenibacillus odorifer]
MLRMLRGPVNTSYTWKIMISFVLVLLIPVTLSAVFIYIRSVQYVEDQSKTALKEALAKEKENVHQIFNDYRKLGSQIAQYPLLISYFDDLYMSDTNKIDFSYHYLNSFMDWVRSLETTEYHFRFFTANDNTFQNEWIYHSKPYGNEAWFEEAIQATYSAPYWENLHKARILDYDKVKNPAIRDQEISLFVPMLSYTTNDRNTLLEIFIAPDAIFGGLGKMEEFKQGAVFVYDSVGQLVYESNHHPAGVLSQLSSQLNKAEQSTTNFVTKVGSQSFLTEIQTLENPNYRIIGMFPQNLVIQETTKARNTFVVCLVAALILMILISYVFSRKLMKKIKRLVKVMRSVQKGNLNTQVVIEGNDEIDELGKDFNRMLNRINELIETVYKTEILQKDALLKALENQVNPHFLYNTLETIKMMAEINREREISDALTSLGAMVRYNLTKDNRLVLITEEIEQIRSYCSLQNLMMNGRLELVCSIAEQIYSLKMLKLILQPIVENAILHGFRNFDGQCVIKISAEVYQNNIRFTICDNGNGIEPGKLRALRERLENNHKNRLSPGENGIGLSNVNDRLKLAYGSCYGIEIESEMREGTRIYISIPVID